MLDDYTEFNDVNEIEGFPENLKDWLNRFPYTFSIEKDSGYQQAFCGNGYIQYGRTIMIIISKECLYARPQSYEINYSIHCYDTEYKKTQPYFSYLVEFPNFYHELLNTIKKNKAFFKSFLSTH